MLRAISLCLFASSCGAARHEGPSESPSTDIKAVSSSNFVSEKTNATDSHAVWRALSRLTHDSQHISRHIMTHPLASISALRPLGHAAFLQAMSTLNLTALSPVTPTSDQPEKIKLPPKTIPLVKGVPLIPEDAQKVLQQTWGLRVNYSYYYDVDTDTVRYSTPEDLEKAIDLDKPKTIQQFLKDLGISLLPMVLLAFCYKSSVSDNRPPLPAVEDLGPVGLNGGGFKSGMCDCFADIAVCCHACCCPAMRVADTISKAGLMGFWTAVAVYVLIDASAQALGLFVAMKDHQWIEIVKGLAFVVVFVPCRQGIRLRLGGGQADTCTQITDVFGWFCFSCCAMAQEARELDHVNGVQVNCPCSLTTKAQTLPLVGEPIPTATATAVST